MKIEELKESLRTLVPDLAAEVAPIYPLLKWTWRDEGIPDQAAIEAELNRHINCLDANCTASGSGGLEAFWKGPTEDTPGEYGIRFSIKRSQHY